MYNTKVIPTYETDEDSQQRFNEKLSAAIKARAANNPWSRANMAKRAERERSRYHPFIKRRRATASG